MIEKKTKELPDQHVDTSTDEKKSFVEPKLTFIEPKLTKHGAVTKITQGFFGTFVP